MKDGIIFERCFVTLIAQLAAEKFRNHTDFATIAFSDRESPIGTWRTMRNGANGKYRNITITDAYIMAKTVGYDLDELFWRVRMEIKNGWDINTQDIRVLNQGVPGRPTRRKEASI